MKHDNVIEMFHRAVDRFSDHTAIDSYDRRLSYREVESRANKLTNRLISSGASKGAVVAILASENIEAIIAILSVLKAGGVFVPLDPRLPAARLKSIVSDVSPKWFITDEEGYHIARGITAAVSSPACIFSIDSKPYHGEAGNNPVRKTDNLGDCDAQRISIPSDPDDMCYIFFTSGSTGKPKGISGRLKGIDHFVNWEVKTFGIAAGSRVSQLTSVSFDAVLRDIFVPLCSGGTICVPPSKDLMLEPKKLVEWIDHQQITLAHFVPSVFHSIVCQGLKSKYFSHLRYILLAGEPLLPSDIRTWMDVFGHRIQLVNLYGPSETTMTKLFYLIRPEDGNRTSIPIGTPMEGAAVIVIDSQGKQCSIDAIGEICIGTPYRSLGYFNQPELTREVFIKNPFNNDPNDIIYKTGDYGRILEDGNLEYCGRRDHQVKIRGVRVELGEIEGELRRHENVTEAVVVDREDSGRNRYLCAYVVLNSRISPVELREFLATRLPEYMLPSFIVEMQGLPRTISGKVDRHRLPAPELMFNESSPEIEERRSPIEKQVAEIWAEVLGLQRVGIHDSFYEVGGHSLMAFQVLSRLTDSFGLDVPIRTFLEKSTVAAQALAITQMLAEKEDDHELARLIDEIDCMSGERLAQEIREEIH